MQQVVCQKLTSYYTTLDSNPIQIMPLDCTITASAAGTFGLSQASEDYEYHKKMLKGTVLEMPICIVTTGSIVMISVV